MVPSTAGDDSFGYGGVVQRKGNEMYNNAMIGSVPTAGLLAATGPGQALWIFLGGFALVSAGMAVSRILPKEQA